MAMTGVLRPGHVALRVTDLEAAVKHYGQVLGLIETGRDAQGRVYFKAWDEHDHHSVVLRKADAPGMDYMGFRVDSEATLDSLAAAVEGSRLATDLQWIPAGEHLHTGRRFRFTVPTGHAIELFASKDKVGNGLPDVNPDRLGPGTSLTAEDSTASPSLPPTPCTNSAHRSREPPPSCRDLEMSARTRFTRSPPTG